MDKYGLEFITDVALRKTIEDSIEYIYVLTEESKKEDRSNLYKEETYRVAILYIVSVIEAVLLYLYKKHKEKITYLEYKFVVSLPHGYRHGDDNESRVVMAVQKIVEKAEHQIGVSDLVTFFQERNLMRKETGEAILKINNIRNTLHLNKPRDTASCDISQVESALKLLIYVIQRAPKSILKD